MVTAIRILAVVFALLLLAASSMQQQRFPSAGGKPRRLDAGIEWKRDAAGELRYKRAPEAAAGAAGTSALPAIRVEVNLVEIHVTVTGPDGAYLLGLQADDFRLFEDGVEQALAHFDASTRPASVALLLDASPSVFRELAEIKRAARALAGRLAPQDEVAVVALADQVHLLLPFSSDRALLDKAVEAVELLRGTGLSPGSRIYEAVYLAGRELFGGRTGRKAIVLLTDGQDSSLGLSWDPASALPRPAEPDRLTFEDVCRTLAAEGIEAHVISALTRPKVLTEEWLASATRGRFLARARALEIPHYTAYLAELVRTVGGRLYFLREPGTLEQVYQRIAESVRAQYTLGYYPSAGVSRPGWREVRIELPRRPQVQVVHRTAYYVPARQ